MRRSLAIQLIVATLLASAVSAVGTSPATLLARFDWNNSAGWFGGFSALHLSENGRQMIVLGDRSRLVTARINRDGDQIRNIQILRYGPIFSSKGRSLSGRAGDSEGIAVAPDGSLYISFEGVHRVVHYSTPGAKAKVLPRPEAFHDLERNGSFEALAIDDRGRLYTLTEKSRTADGKILVYRWDGHHWTRPFVLPPSGRFLPVAADFGPDGRLYVLERAVSFFGFRSRLRRWVIADDAPVSQEILFETSTGTHDNLEGLSVWRDVQGRLRATMISDDNFFFLQRTELVEYLLPD
ncbi:esterase-like activity of phytase family protein [Ruegeria sp. SCSIO 43209]|uniref:esterase-like activity of phytase family protein n=1 Tax=Ruegeria sp. SCSIO 43209 TaxID=2793010 RepID=UPI00147D8E9A|nr:esterase-like activity of phytase family protein [Ruegeria sp. SCSIO 43209]UAB88638.1 esterase-like activity of phytase family protein [Ruegeria sp. SCSIO 43209]